MRGGEPTFSTTPSSSVSEIVPSKLKTTVCGRRSRTLLAVHRKKSIARCRIPLDAFRQSLFRNPDILARCQVEVSPTTHLKRSLPFPYLFPFRSTRIPRLSIRVISTKESLKNLKEFQSFRKLPFASEATSERHRLATDVCRCLNCTKYRQRQPQSVRPE